MGKHTSQDFKTSHMQQYCTTTKKEHSNLCSISSHLSKGPNEGCSSIIHASTGSRGNGTSYMRFPKCPKGGVSSVSDTDQASFSWLATLVHWQKTRRHNPEESTPKVSTSLPYSTENTSDLMLALGPKTVADGTVVFALALTDLPTFL